MEVISPKLSFNFKNKLNLSLSPSRDLNTGPADYKSAALPTKPLGRHILLLSEGKKGGDPIKMPGFPARLVSIPGYPENDGNDIPGQRNHPGTSMSRVLFTGVMAALAGAILVAGCSTVQPIPAAGRTR